MDPGFDDGALAGNFNIRQSQFLHEHIKLVLSLFFSSTMSIRLARYFVVVALLVCYAWRSSATTFTSKHNPGEVLTVFVSHTTHTPGQGGNLSL